jgi:hypothetical protein
MHRSLPQSGQLFRTLFLYDVVAGAVAYGAWRWAEQKGVALMRTPTSRLWVEVGLVVVAALLAALLVRSAVYRNSGWQPTFLVALGAVVTTPFLGTPLMRSIAVAEVGQRPVAPTGIQLRHRTTTSRMGDTKRLSEL